MKNQCKKISSQFYDIVDPIAEVLDNIQRDTKKMVNTGIRLSDNFRHISIRIRRITHRYSMRVLSSLLSFAIPIDIEHLVDDITT